MYNIVIGRNEQEMYMQLPDQKLQCVPALPTLYRRYQQLSINHANVHETPSICMEIKPRKL